MGQQQLMAWWSDVLMWIQVVGSRDSVEEDWDEIVMLFWDEEKTQKSIRDLVFDSQLEDLETLSYYRCGMLLTK